MFCSVSESIFKPSPCNRGQIGIKLEAKHNKCKKLANFMYKKDIMLTGLKLSSLGGGGAMEPNFDILKMQK